MRFDRLLVGAAIILVLYLFTNAIFNFFSVSQQQELFRFFILGAPVTIIFFLFPRFALVLLAIFVYSVDWLSAWVGIVPREFTWFIDLILIVFLLRYFLLFPRLRTRPVPMTIKWIWGLLFFVVLSALLNHVSATTALIGLRVSMKYLLLFVVLYSMDFSEKFYRRLLYLQFAVALVQIPVVLVEFTIIPAKEEGLWDLITGTFGHNGTGVLAVFLLGWIAFLIATMLVQRRLRWGILLIIILLGIPPLLGESKAFFFFLIALAFFMLRYEWTKRPLFALTIGSFCLLFIVGVDYILIKSGYWAEGRNPLTYITRVDEIIEKDLAGPLRYFKDGVWVTDWYIGRAYATKHAFLFATSSPRAFCFGFGPGAATQSVFAAYESPSVAHFRSWGVSSGRQCLPWLMVEYGIIGTLLFLVPLYLLYRRATLLSRSPRKDYKILAAAFQGITVVFLFQTYISSVLQSDQLSFFYWTTAVIITQLSYTVKDKKELEQASIPTVQTLRAPGTLTPIP